MESLGTHLLVSTRVTPQRSKQLLLQAFPRDLEGGRSFASGPRGFSGLVLEENHRGR